ncbi:MAG: hypothetical protein KDI41_13870 [Pseudomonadales bacterium]|nr:hypothetical protein [Pseudomonadales bacterium]
MDRCAIVVFGFEMCASGRIVYYLNAMQADRRHNVFLLAIRLRVPGAPGCKCVTD